MASCLQRSEQYQACYNCSPCEHVGWFLPRSREQVALSGFTWESRPPFGFGLAHVGFSLFDALETWPPAISSSLTPEACGMWKAGGERPVRGQSSISGREKFWKTTGEEWSWRAAAAPITRFHEPLRLVASATVQSVQASRQLLLHGLDLTGC